MKKVTVFCFMLVSLFGYSQVGIHTSNPQAIFHVDGAKDNPATGVPNVTQQANDVVATATGSLGVGIMPNAKFHVEGTESLFSNGTSKWALDPEGATPSSRLSIIDRTSSIRRLILSENGDAFLGGSLGTAGESAIVRIMGGNVGVGINPTNKLHINAVTDPLRLQGVVSGNNTTDQILTMDTNGVVKSMGTLSSLSIPVPAVFRLETTQNDFLNGQGAGGSQVVPMALVKNGIQGLTYNTTTSTVTFPAGMYQMMFVYEGGHNAVGCTISSYFVDFPLNAVNTRIHSTASHIGGGLSNHGGTINYITTIPANRTWQIRLGRGQSGNCSGAGMGLAGTSTQLLIYKIGD